MVEMAFGLMFLAAVVAFGLVALAFGADSRDGRDWNPHHKI